MLMSSVQLRKPRNLARVFRTATFSLTFSVILFNIYRRFVLDAEDPYQCKALLSDGRWLDQPEREPNPRPFVNWHLPGCLLYSYNISEIAQCNENGKILFVGDSVIRQVFWSTARKIEGESDWVFQQRAMPDTHSSIEYEVDGARLKFLWDPWLNSSALHEELGAFRERRERNSKDQNVSVGTENRDLEDRGSVVMLIGGGLSHARHYKEGAAMRFKQSVDSIISSAYGEGAPADMRDAPTASKDGIGDEIFFAPVIEPIYDKLSPARKITITPSKIDAMNHYLGERSFHRSLNVLWSYSNMTNGRPETYGESGLHVIEPVTNNMADVLLNLRCNAKAAQREGYPYSRTCCSAYRPMNVLQITGFLATIALFGWITVSNIKRTRATASSDRPCYCIMANSRGWSSIDGRQKPIRLEPGDAPAARSKLLFAVSTLLSCICYCFLTDRTQVFDKLPKRYSTLELWLMLGLVVVVCLFNIRTISASQYRLPRLGFPVRLASATFLPRVQSHECKGWMQVFLLIHGYTRARSVLDSYEVHRIFLACYLFLSGYGHSMSFLQNRDFSLRRVATVLLRLNILAVLLSFMMDRPYASYHFAPLVSFWFLVGYFTLKPTRYSNGSFRYLFAKIAISALLVTSALHVPGILDLSFLVLRYTSRASLDVEAWRRYLSTETYVVYVGMLVAILHIEIRSIQQTPLARLTGVPQFLRRYFRALQAIAIGFALAILPGFRIVTHRSPDKADYDWWMPYIAWLPVISFVILRNATRFLRSHFCVPFAWLGHMSLELYLLSQHIWLAGDGYGLLRIGSRSGGSSFCNRWLDFLVLTPIFVWVAWCVKCATVVVTAWIMGAETGMDGYKGGDDAENGHKRTGSDLAQKDFSTVLPEPAGFEDRNGNLGLPSEVKRRLFIVVAAVWLGSWVSHSGRSDPMA